MKQKIDISTWSRKAQWEHFSRMDFPFYHVSFYIDVTPARAYAKLHGVSCYRTLCYLVAKALNSVENFRYRIQDDEVYLVDVTHPSFPVLRNDSSDFQILSCRMQDSLEEFNRRAADIWEEICRNGTENAAFINGDGDIPEEELCYMSCLPWIDATCISSERTLDKDDSIPRISWGKYIRLDRGEHPGLWGDNKKRQGGHRLLINMTVDVNHRLMDGYHIGLFATRLQELIDQL